ncbi:cytochrome c, class I [Mesorhizobium opportunistum WSM2075]|uniref:Cytochrome c, class I n=2 Tax=Mesorhizobium opportunistum TaxID=593909 RepID=F7Y7J6_MESOW|nr:cytochrome c, class I [Mesorhizobium opportunistum WSM2075]
MPGHRIYPRTKAPNAPSEEEDEISRVTNQPIMVRLKHVLIAAVCLPIVILLGAWIGFFNVGASTGHWKVTAWFLELAMRSAVRTYALTVNAPRTLDRRGIPAAAGHFAQGCAICHGAPGELRSPAVLRMLPQPPDLALTVGDWTDAQLFRIVKHGIRFTGMPAWPARDRDDEVWAMVAFLRELPKLDANEFRALAFDAGGAIGNAQQPTNPGALANCTRCHGSDGEGRSGLIPALAGQNEAYLLASLEAFARGDRTSGFMALPVTGITPAEMAALARHFAAQPPVSTDGDPVPAEVINRGQQIAEAGIPERNVPACSGCHIGADKNPNYPRLDGQHAPYLEGQLKLFRSEGRGGTQFWRIMAAAAQRLTDEDIRAAAAYFSKRSEGRQ